MNAQQIVLSHSPEAVCDKSESGMYYIWERRCSELPPLGKGRDINSAWECAVNILKEEGNI